MRKYNKIERFGKRMLESILLQDIVIQEKIDGANSHFKLVDGEIKCFSRNNELDSENTLQGFFEWVNKNINKNLLVEGFLYYGEWAVKHKLEYGENHRQFYLFDIYAESYSGREYGQYLPIEWVKEASRRLGIRLAPILYEGKFQSIEHVESFIGKSQLGDVGEGVVLKSYDAYDRFGNQIFYKFVSDEFAEIMKVRKHNLKASCEVDRFVETFLNEARIEKILFKLKDEDKIPQELNMSDMGLVLKSIGNSVWKDIIEEESDVLMKVVENKIKKKTPVIVRSLIERSQ